MRRDVLELAFETLLVLAVPPKYRARAVRGVMWLRFERRLERERLLEVLRRRVGQLELLAALRARADQLRPGVILNAAAVPSGALVRDGAGTFYVRLGRRGQVARGAGPWRAWGEVRRFAWFKRGRFELVAMGLTETFKVGDLAVLGEAHERIFGASDFGDGCDVLASAEVV